MPNSQSAPAVTGPTAELFPTAGTEPGVNGDVNIQVSLNGRLIYIHRGDPELSAEERFGLNWEEFDNLIGRLMTLADATFTEPIQRKAYKDMVRQHIKEWVTGCIVDARVDAGLEGGGITAPFVGHLTADDNMTGVETPAYAVWVAGRTKTSAGGTSVGPIPEKTKWLPSREARFRVIVDSPEMRGAHTLEIWASSLDEALQRATRRAIEDEHAASLKKEADAKGSADLPSPTHAERLTSEGLIERAVVDEMIYARVDYSDQK